MYFEKFSLTFVLFFWVFDHDLPHCTEHMSWYFDPLRKPLQGSLQYQLLLASLPQCFLRVQAAVEMTSSAVENMKNTGANIDEQTQQQITTNLLTVICSGASATPTIQMNTM